MTNKEAKEIIEANAVPVFPLKIAYQDWLTAIHMAEEALKKQMQNCEDCRHADCVQNNHMIYCLEHSCVMSSNNCCRDWSSEDDE